MWSVWMNELLIQSLSIDWNRIEQHSYLRKIEALKNLEELVFEKNIAFLVGENGTGKSTLLEALAVAYGFNPEGGTKNYSFIWAMCGENQEFTDMDFIETKDLR